MAQVGGCHDSRKQFELIEITAWKQGSWRFSTIATVTRPLEVWRIGAIGPRVSRVPTVGGPAPELVGSRATHGQPGLGGSRRQVQERRMESWDMLALWLQVTGMAIRCSYHPGHQGDAAPALPPSPACFSSTCR